MPVRWLRSLAVAGLAVVAVTQDAVAQTQGGWRKELADKAAQAQAAGQKGNYSEAIRLLKEAKAKAPLSPQEEQGINELMIWAASGAKDHKLVLATVDERLATGRVTGADLTRKLRLKATTHYALRDYRERGGGLREARPGRAHRGRPDAARDLADAAARLRQGDARRSSARSRRTTRPAARARTPRCSRC